MEVKYRNMCGIIDFVCDWYIVLKLPPASKKHNSPKLLIYTEYQKEIVVLKDSEK